MKQRLPAEERKCQLFNLMQCAFRTAKTQRDFSAAQLARQAGISDVLFYRLVGPEFHALQYQLPGLRQAPDAELHALRKEVARLQQALQKSEAEVRQQSKREYHVAIKILHQLEQENLALKGQVNLLEKRLAERGYMFVLPDYPPNHGRDSEDEGF